MKDSEPVIANSPRASTDPRDLIWGKAKRAIERRLTRLDPDLERYVREFAYGEIYARGVLEPKVQEFLATAMLMALGNPEELKTHLRGALLNGATEQELREVLLFAVPYLGFPKVIGAFQMLKSLLEGERSS
jgi:4-carboxymuconolactone decarboxylase